MKKRRGAEDGKDVEQSCTFDIVFNNLVDCKRIYLLFKKHDLMWLLIAHFERIPKRYQAPVLWAWLFIPIKEVPILKQHIIRD